MKLLQFAFYYYFKAGRKPIKSSIKKSQGYGNKREDKVCDTIWRIQALESVLAVNPFGDENYPQGKFCAEERNHKIAIKIFSF